MISRFLSFIIIVLTLLSAAVLFAYVYQYPNAVFEAEKQVEETKMERLRSAPSKILSTFSLIPYFNTERTFFSVVIENHEDARPYHSGIEDAVMIQEFLVEGFISRFVATFDTRGIPKDIGPVRSLRPYFLDSIAPWSRTVFHAGGSPEALERVTNGTHFFARNLLYFDDEHGSLRKDGPVAPHDLFLNKALIKSFLEEVPDSLLQSVQWPPFEKGIPEGGEVAESIRVNFFNALHNVSFDFQPLSQKYERTNGEEISPARPSAVVIMEVPIDEIGAYGRLFMTLNGGGKAQVFHSGKMWDARWSRSSFTEPFRITDTAGENIPFAQGQVWMTVLPTLERVSWE
jgi:hypothetical protein